MRIVKKLVIAFLISITIPLVIAIFLEKEYSVEREIVINKPITEVFNYIKLLKNQSNYSSWATRDPEMEKSYTGIDGEIGFISAWDSQHPEVGVGEQEIVGIKELERIDYELRFFKPFEAEEPAFMSTESISENETKVVWGFTGHFEYPMNLMLWFMDIENKLGNDLSTGLSNLKEKLED